jgi:hypothetical protein
VAQREQVFRVNGEGTCTACSLVHYSCVQSNTPIGSSFLVYVKSIATLPTTLIFPSSSFPETGRREALVPENP